MQGPTLQGKNATVANFKSFISKTIICLLSLQSIKLFVPPELDALEPFLSGTVNVILN